MSITKSLYGITRIIPETDEKGWGSEVTGTLDDLIDGVNGMSMISTGNTVEVENSTPTTLSNGGILTPVNRVHRVQGNGGPVSLDGTTAFTDGSRGQMLTLIGDHATNTVTINHGANTQMNGPITLGLSDSIEFRWSTTVNDWEEQGRST